MPNANACIRCIFKTFIFTGRAPRDEFWSYFFLALVLEVMFSWHIIETYDSVELILIMMAVLMLPFPAVTVRRLHDLGFGAGGFLIPLALFVTALVTAFQIDSNQGLLIAIGAVLLWLVYLFGLMLVFLGQGESGPNRYGPDPLGRMSASANGYGNSGINAAVCSTGQQPGSAIINQGAIPCPPVDSVQSNPDEYDNLHDNEHLRPDGTSELFNSNAPWPPAPGFAYYGYDPAMMSPGPAGHSGRAAIHSHTGSADHPGHAFPGFEYIAPSGASEYTGATQSAPLTATALGKDTCAASLPGSASVLNTSDSIDGENHVAFWPYHEFMYMSPEQYWQMMAWYFPYIFAPDAAASNAEAHDSSSPYISACEGSVQNDIALNEIVPTYIVPNGSFTDGGLLQAAHNHEVEAPSSDKYNAPSPDDYNAAAAACAADRPTVAATAAATAAAADGAAAMDMSLYSMTPEQWAWWQYWAMLWQQNMAMQGGLLSEELSRGLAVGLTDGQTEGQTEGMSGMQSEGVFEQNQSPYWPYLMSHWCEPFYQHYDIASSECGSTASDSGSLTADDPEITCFASEASHEQKADPQTAQISWYPWWLYQPAMQLQPEAQSSSEIASAPAAAWTAGAALSAAAVTAGATYAPASSAAAPAATTVAAPVPAAATAAARGEGSADNGVSGGLSAMTLPASMVGAVMIDGQQALCGDGRNLLSTGHTVAWQEQPPAITDLACSDGPTADRVPGYQ